LSFFLSLERERERDIDAALYNNNNIAGIKGDNCCFALPC
jgi:hypothetical protein